MPSIGSIVGALGDLANEIVIEAIQHLRLEAAQSQGPRVSELLAGTW